VGPGNKGFVITVVVDDLPAMQKMVVEHGGTVVVSPFRIDGVGDLMYFNDTEGHRVGLMQRVAGL
jgi:hypothetical protein